MNLSEFFSQVFGIASQGIGGDVYRQLEPWLRQISARAAPRWGRVLLADLRCQVTKGCETRAIAICDVCERPTCLMHGRPAHTADVICERCVFELKKQKGKQRPARRQQAFREPPFRQAPFEPVPPPRQRPPPPPPQPGDLARRLAALRTLELGPQATEQQIHARFRELAAKFHPDRHQQKSPAERARIEKLFTQISAAYSELVPRGNAA